MCLEVEYERHKRSSNHCTKHDGDIVYEVQIYHLLTYNFMKYQELILTEDVFRDHLFFV